MDIVGIHPLWTSVINIYANFVTSLNELKCRNFNEFVNATIL
jgi:hypothetical protein